MLSDDESDLSLQTCARVTVVLIEGFSAASGWAVRRVKLERLK